MKLDLYKKCFEAIASSGLEYHFVPCDGFNRVVVYHPSQGTQFNLLHKDDETQEIELNPEGDVVPDFCFDLFKQLQRMVI